MSKSPGVKERILESAKELFISKGYAGTSVRDIAAAAGANVAHVKYYFDSKANLFEIIFDDAFNILITRVSTIIESDLPFDEMIEKDYHLLRIVASVSTDTRVYIERNQS